MIQPQENTSESSQEPTIESLQAELQQLRLQLKAKSNSMWICVGAAGCGDESELCGWIDEHKSKLQQAEADRDRYLKALSKETVKETIEQAKKGYDH